MRRLARVGVAALLVLVPFAWLLYGADLWNGPAYPAIDADAYALAVEAIRESGTPYYRIPPPGPHDLGSYYLYPPPFAALLTLVTGSFLGIYRMTVVANLLGVAALAWATARLAGYGARAAAVIGAFLYVMPVVPPSIYIGNVETAVQGLAAAALLAPPAVSVPALATAAVLKVNPFWALGVAVVRLRAWAAFAIAAGAWTLISILALGVSGTVDACIVWLRDIAPTLGQGQFVSRTILGTNFSPSFAPLRLLLEPGPLPGWARAYLTVVQLGVPAWTVWRCRSMPWHLQAGWALVASVLASPIVRPNHAILVLLAGALWIATRRWVNDDGIASRGGPSQGRAGT